MDFTPSSTTAQPGALALLISPTNKIFLVRLTAGGNLHTHRGIVNFDDLIGKPWGSQVYSHLGSMYYMLQPSLSDILREIKRNTQILYPKEIGFILVSMGIGPGCHVIEAGTGSGALTTALAWAVGPQGHVTSYEMRQDFQNLARKNLAMVGLEERVTLKLRDIAEGFDEQNADALFLDLPNPYDYVEQAHRALKPGGYFGTLLPTTNQVIRLLSVLHSRHFAFIDVCEVLIRYYKPNPARFRPVDRMIAHTGYLVFARAFLPSVELPEQFDTAGEESDKDFSNDESTHS